MIISEDIKPIEEDTAVDPINVDGRLALKPLSKKDKTECIRKTIETVINSHNLESTIGNQEGFNIAIIFSDNPEETLMAINATIIPTMNSYIESTIGESASNYNRSMILFESEIQKDKVFIRWPN